MYTYRNKNIYASHICCEAFLREIRPRSIYPTNLMYFCIDLFLGF